MTQYCYFNKKIIPLSKAHISISDTAILRGYGIFEVIRTFNRKPFLLNEHLRRLHTSARAMNLHVPISDTKISQIIKTLIRKNKVKEAAIRIMLTGGISRDSISYDRQTPTFYIIVSEFLQLPQKYYKNGIKLITLEHKRDLPRVKTTNYVAAIRQLPRLKKEKAFGLLYTHNGNVLEEVTSNFFIVRKKTLVTPKNDILIGITRNFVIKIACLYYKVIERPMKLSEVYSADEAFITATNKDIVPVVKINNHRIGGGKPGSITKKLMELFYNKAMRTS